MNAISGKLFSISRGSSSGIVQRNGRRTELTVLTARKGAIGKNGVRRKGVRKRNATRRAPRAVASDTTWTQHRGGGSAVEERQEGREWKASKAMFGGAIMK